MPWYWKAGIGFGAALAVVRLTTAMGSAVRWRMAAWAATLALLAIAAGLSSYYYIVNAPRDDQDDVPAHPTTSAPLFRRG